MLVRFTQYGRVQDHLACDCDIRCHISEPEHDTLVFDQFLAECLTFARVVSSNFKGGSRHANRLCGDTNATAFQI